MPVLWILLTIGILALAAASRLIWMWLKYRGERVITCPANMRTAGVRVDARRAAASSLVKAPDLRLCACTRWPEMGGCGQDCLKQIEASPAGCLVRSVLAEWYEAETCASCGRLFGPINWAGPKPAIRTGDGREIEWQEIPVEQLYDVLADGSPICFGCHMASRLMREHPELVTERGRPALSSERAEIRR
jgi:hypothetical protein